jgi:hypothetical protein
MMGLEVTWSFFYSNDMPLVIMLVAMQKRR